MNLKSLYLAVFFTIFKLSTLFSQTLEIPVITNVSVDYTTQHALISWTMNNPADVDGYIIKRQIFNYPGVVDGSYNTVETINDANQFSYLDISTAYGPSLPGNGIETYRVVAFKDMGGGNIIYSNMSNPVSTMYLFPVDFDLCLEQNALIWTSYKGFGTDLISYNIYYSNTLSGTPILAGQNAADDTTFVHEGVASNLQYYYYIEAVSSQGGLVSNSNYQTITTTMPPLPAYMNADYATVEIFEQVDLSFTVDPAAQVNSYLLLKSDSLNGTYDTIASFSSGSSNVTYSDFVKTNQVVAFYKLVAVNTCGIPSRESNVANNIVLEARISETDEYTNELSWNTYENWLGGVESFSVYRSIDGGTYEEIAQLNGSILLYSDDISEWVQPEINDQASKGHFCYYILASEGAGNPNGITGQSKSNISCAHQEAIVYLPNAFNPNSATEENRTFKPVASFVDDYKLMIYNRWGEIIFQSADPLEGWNGRDKSGSMLKKGTYVFYLKYRNRNNKLVEKSGQINLVY